MRGHNLMKVKNQQCIRRLSYKSLWASRKRNMIAIIAIALTTLLFTALFTIVLSINSSYQTYQFRQVGGYSHGTFKDVNAEQIAAISAHPNVKEVGVRTVIGFCTTGAFAKAPAEVSYMDANTAKWSYALPTTGRMPEEANEIAMDTTALEMLGITPELGTEVQFSYTLNDKEQWTGEEISDTFILTGYWDYDDLMPIHYINISENYMKEIVTAAIADGMEPFRTDLNVMMASAIDIRGQMEQVDTDLGYTWESFSDENSVRIGVNWGYTSSQISETLDPETILSMIAFIVLVVFTGYLIIYNIFQISVTGDIRFYGLLKTIGVTPRQLRRIIRQQALLLCLIGIPIGLLLGYVVGAVLTPEVIKNTTLGETASTVSVSPFIFAGSTLFSLITVLLSCKKPGRIAAKVSPIEATKYTENSQTGKKNRSTRGAKVYHMAFANLGRNRSKTILVFVSLALSVILLNLLCTFVGGFDMDLYLGKLSCADFIVSGTDYFRFNHSPEYITEDAIEEIKTNTGQSFAGSGYTFSDNRGAETWISEAEYRAFYANYASEEELDQILSFLTHDGDKVATGILLLGLDPALFDKLTVLEGDPAPLFEENSHAIALSAYTNDYRNIVHREQYPKIGDTIRLTYTEAYYIDSRTGERSTEDTPEEYLEYYISKRNDVDYTVCALMSIPYSMSYRYSSIGSYDAILPAETMQRDSGLTIIPLYYLFDTPTEEAEQSAEAYLADLTSHDLTGLMYESKETLRADFKQFQNLFMLLGGLLCAIIGLVGILNFFNAIMTSILSRRREFAVLQAVGMTNNQLKSMLIFEGLLYSLGSVFIALILSVITNPLIGKMLKNMFWFFNPHFTILPVVIVIPVFMLLGWLIPTILYGQTTKHSVVERLRETE